MEKDKFLFTMLNNLLLGFSQLVDDIPMGGRNYLEMAFDHNVGRMYEKYKESYHPHSNEAIDLCQDWIDMMHDKGFLNKDDYELKNGEDRVHIQVEKVNCVYHEYCTTARKENIPQVCPRMLSCRWIAAKFTGQPYQLAMEEILGDNCCQGVIYPGERIDEILSKDGNNISMAGERAIVLSTNAFGILVKTIYEYAPHIVERVLYESTYHSSLIEYDRVKGFFGSNREVIEHLLYTIDRMGNIRYEIVEFDDIQKRALVRGYGSYMIDIFKANRLFNSPKTSCASGKGRLAAYFTKAWGEEIVCEEMKCEAAGDEYCEFVLLPRHL